MDSDSKAATVRSLDRNNLRLTGDTFVEIDAACAARPENVLRNTWIAKAVEDNLLRERAAPAAEDSERRAHG
jgi:hypothetical protein